MAAKSIERLLGAQITVQRRRRGLTQAELAEAANVSSETISRLERGAAMPSLTRLSEIAGVLQVELRDLLPSGGSSARQGALAKLNTVAQDLTPDQIETLVRIAYAAFTSGDEPPAKRRRRRARA